MYPLDTVVEPSNDFKGEDDIGKEDFFNEGSIGKKPNEFGYQNNPALTDVRLVEHHRIYATRWLLHILRRINYEAQKRQRSSETWQRDKLKLCQERNQRRNQQSETENAHMDLMDVLKKCQFHLSHMDRLSIDLRPVSAMEAEWKIRDNVVKAVESQLRAAWQAYGTEEYRNAWTTAMWRELREIQNEVGELFRDFKEDSQKYHDENIPRARLEEHNQQWAVANNTWSALDPSFEPANSPILDSRFGSDTPLAWGLSLKQDVSSDWRSQARSPAAKYLLTIPNLLYLLLRMVRLLGYRINRHLLLSH